MAQTAFLGRRTTRRSHPRTSCFLTYDNVGLSSATTPRFPTRRQGYKNYLQHEPQFLEYLKRRDSCDDTRLVCYQRFFRHLTEKDLGGALDEDLASPLGQLLDELRAVEETTLEALERGYIAG